MRKQRTLYIAVAEEKGWTTRDERDPLKVKMPQEGSGVEVEMKGLELHGRRVTTDDLIEPFHKRPGELHQRIADEFAQQIRTADLGVSQSSGAANPL